MTILGRYFHTIRHLRPSQVTGRLRYRLYSPRPDTSPAPVRRAFVKPWIEGPLRQPSMTGPDTFVFLGRTRSIRNAADWNGGAEKLWLYNLHYLDDLNAEASEQRLEWHATLIQRWIEENPPGHGNGWEPYPVSLRLVNLIKWLIRGQSPPPGLLASIATQARWLSSRLEWHILGNHLFANAKALVFAGLFFDGPQADTWLRRGLEVLDSQIPEQVLGDGGHFEVSPMYHSIILEDLLDLSNLSAAAGGTWPLSWAEAVDRMRRWLAVVNHPDGEIALFNDAAFDIAPSFGEIERYAARLGFDEVSPPGRGLVLLPDSGYARLSAGAATVLADVGAIGPDYLPGHAHADTLGFELSVGSCRLLVDSGVSEYGGSAERQRQRGTAAHNTVVIDAADSSEVWGGFRVARRARIRDRRALGNDDEGLTLEATHDGYARLHGRPLHRRRWQLRPASLVVRDEVSGAGEHLVELRFHLHPDVALGVLDGVATLSAPGLAPIRVRLDPQLAWEQTTTTYHPRFGIALPNACLHGQRSGSLPFRCETTFEFPPT